MTAANLLLARRPPGFAALPLRDLEISADLGIVLREGQSFASVPGFPPLTHYRLSSFPHPGAVVLATGPRTIFFIRQGEANALPEPKIVVTVHDKRGS